jgi:hypothetical protein
MIAFKHGGISVYEILRSAIRHRSGLFKFMLIAIIFLAWMLLICVLDSCS